MQCTSTYVAKIIRLAFIEAERIEPYSSGLMEPSDFFFFHGRPEKDVFMS